MKHATRSKEDKFREFEFRDEDNPEPRNRWLANPNFDDHDAGIKYQFLQKFSAVPVAQNKEVPTVTIIDDDDDDDDDEYDVENDGCSTEDSLPSPLDSPFKVRGDVQDGFSSMSDKDAEQRCLNDSNVDHKLSPPYLQTRVSQPENGHVNSPIPESPCADGAVDLDGNDIAQESFPSTSDSELEVNEETVVEQTHGQSVDDSETDVKGTIAIHTDYVAYGNKYYPASLVMMSRESIKMKASALEEESATCSSEWNVDDILTIEIQWSSLADVAKLQIRLLTKVAVPGESTNDSSGIELLEFLVPNWSEQRDRIMSLHMRYNAAVLSMEINLKSCNGDVVPFEDSNISADPYIPNFEGPFEEVVYPKGEIDAVSVRKTDVDLLQPDVFVNDTIIDFYITYLKNQIPSERRDKFHFFSSFFFRKLADLDKNPSSISDGKAAFQRVRRWTRKVNIFGKDYIFIPVNYNLHWSLIVLCHPGEVANFNEENSNAALKVPCILHMDSIRGSHAGLKNLMQSYLLEEWKSRQNDTSEDVSSKFLNLRFLSLELPQQTNCSDCGLFLLHYAELFIGEAPLNFSPFRINKFDRFLKRDWFVPDEASLKRVCIQKLIYELLKSRSANCGSPSRNSLLHSSPLPKNDDKNGIELISEKRCPKKSWKGNALCSEPVQDMDTSMLDPGLGMTELFGQCQSYVRGSSYGKPGASMSSVEEVKASVDYYANFSQTGRQPIDRLAESNFGSSPRGFGQQLQWNLELFDHANDSGNTSSSDSHSSEETSSDEYYRDIRSDDLCQKDIMYQSKVIVDSYDRYASASSDVMETPPEDSQELADKYGTHDHEDAVVSNQVEVVEESQEKPAMDDDNEKLEDVDSEVKDVTVVRNDDEMVIVEDSPPHEQRPTKRSRLTPLCSEVNRHVSSSPGKM